METTIPTCDWRGCTAPVAVVFAIGQYDYRLCNEHEAAATNLVDSEMWEDEDPPAAQEA